MPRIVLGVLVLALSSPAHAQAVRGVVLETNQPAAGAFVVVHWTGRRPGFFHYESVCLQAAIARTDAQGRFEIVEPPPLRSTFLVFRNEPAVAVFKPGFDTSGGKGEWTLTKTQLDAARRRGIAEILQGYGCADEKGNSVLTDPQGVLPAYRAALAAEAGEKPPAKPEVRVLQPGGPRPASP